MTATTATATATTDTPRWRRRLQYYVDDGYGHDADGHDADGDGHDGYAMTTAPTLTTATTERETAMMSSSAWPTTVGFILYQSSARGSWYSECTALGMI